MKARKERYENSDKYRDRENEKSVLNLQKEIETERKAAQILGQRIGLLTRKEPVK